MYRKKFMRKLLNDVKFVAGVWLGVALICFIAGIMCAIAVKFFSLGFGMLL